MDEPRSQAICDRELIAANIRAYRARRSLSQQEVVERMRELGFSSWHRQTMGNIERGDRRVLAEEILGLAKVLNTFPVHLISEPRY